MSDPLFEVDESGEDLTRADTVASTELSPAEKAATREEHVRLAEGALVRADDLVAGYVPGVNILRGCDFYLQDGELVGIIGPNGAGKSTLIRAVLGLVPVVSGSVTVLGRPPQAARRQVAYVPQADTLDAEFPVSALQAVLMGRYPRVGFVRRPGAADRQAAESALAAVGLAERASARFGTLSGGQRQRVLLARAIAQEPRLLLLDEPFTGVDALSQELLLTALRRLRGAGAAVVMATHDLGLAHLACDEVCLLNRHQIGFGPIGTTLTPERLRATYGGQALELRGDGVIVARP
jgi:manganese/iron transport system ATP-binding protein